MARMNPVVRPVPIADPTYEPVTLTQAKKQLEILLADTDHDDHLVRLIRQSRQIVEHDTGMVAYQRTYVEKYDCWPDERFQLKRRPLVSVTSITYVDSDGDSQTLASSYYDADTGRVSPQIWLAYNQTWPTARDTHNAITVTYVAGHATVAAIPEAYIQACLMMIARDFVDREGNETRYQGTSASMFADAYESLIARLQPALYA